MGKEDLASNKGSSGVVPVNIDYERVKLRNLLLYREEPQPK
jgi:hypothetical protein